MSEKQISSYEALKMYLGNNSKRHRAHVLGSAYRNDYNAVLTIQIELDSNNNRGEITIEGDDQFYNFDFKPSYSTDDSKFELINSTLIINSNNCFGNRIRLEVTAM